MTAADQLLDGLHRSAVVRDDDVTAAQLREAGWRVVQLTALTKADLLRQCAQGLDFPEHFGHNLDALLDCLRDVEEPVALIWPTWRRFKAQHPRDWAGAQAVFEARAEAPGFAVVLPG